MLKHFGILLPQYFPQRPIALWHAVILATALIAILLIRMLATLKDALRQARESEEGLRGIVETAPDAIFIANSDGRVVDVNETAANQLGYTRKELIGMHVWEFVAPEFQSRVRSRFPDRSGPTFYQSRHVRKDGSEVPVELNTCKITFQGQPALLGLARDMTARQQIHERLQALNRQILAAQEEERRRIARDLHDDITQRLTGLSIELGMLRRHASGAIAAGLEQLQGKTIQMAGDLRNIAYAIHPAALEFAGLSAALEGLCKETSIQTKIPIHYAAHGLPEGLPGDVSIALYRIAQEALNNAVKHAEASAIDVVVSGTLEKGGKKGLHLQIQDNGKGFLVEEIQPGSSLGLLSIEERVHLVKGSFALCSLPGKGTRLDVKIPLPELAAAQSRASA